ncbi:glycosyltransferase family 2 protein [Lacticaseibacillus manihotivorans]|jgi:cellulose synthase (UDP-forming)|nr:glycosyltransferase family 2 protein [Lacticaseibacillus manihotivorans]
MGMSNKKRFVYILALVLSVIYLLWRVFFTIPWHAHLFVLIFALLLVTSELFSNFTAFILIALRMLNFNKQQQRLKVPDFAPAIDLPAVDILICTHNEDVDLLRKTINAATFIKYPDRRKVTIVLCDDGNRPEAAALAKEYHIRYIGMTDNKQAKSGNINHALKQLHAPLFVILDADMIPFSTFLMHSVPFFTQNWEQQVVDPDHTKPLGFVQTPQSFYNADIFQFNLYSEKIVANEQDFFSRDVNILNGANQMALFTGSNAVFLRQAVDDVGGFPTDTLTEDFELGAKINFEGYTSLATEHPESSGTTPVDVKGVIKQRTRWARGVMQSCRNLHIFINPKIPFLNRIILINSYLYWWSFARRLIYIAAPLLYALFKIQVVNANFWVLMVVWAPGYFLLHFVLGDASSKIRDERWGEVQETFFAPYLFLPVLLETLGIKEKKFKVTNKKARSTFKDKLYILPYLIMWALTLIAIVYFNYGKWGSEILVGSVITFWLVMHFINLSFCVFICLGRGIVRHSERFERHVHGAMLIDGVDAQIETEDISDGGFSFRFKQAGPQLARGDQFTGWLNHDGYHIKVTGEIMRKTTDDVPGYGAAMTALSTAADRNHYLQLIYDGENELLPDEQDRWITPFDELYMNFVMRFKRIDALMLKLNRSQRPNFKE